MLRVIIGLGIPFTAIVILLPFVNMIRFTIWNIPFLYLWLFAWFVLTSLCLAVCWFGFDQHRTEES